MSNTQSIKSALLRQIIESGSNIAISTLAGNLELLIKSAEIDGMKEARDIMIPIVTDHPNTI